MDNSHSHPPHTARRSCFAKRFHKTDSAPSQNLLHRYSHSWSFHSRSPAKQTLCLHTIYMLRWFFFVWWPGGGVSEVENLSHCRRTETCIAHSCASLLQPVVARTNLKSVKWSFICWGGLRAILKVRLYITWHSSWRPVGHHGKKMLVVLGLGPSLLSSS
jgi:hypothetical protein